MNLIDLSYSCVHNAQCQTTGFDVSVDGMDITIGDGSVCGQEVAGSAFTVEAPASGSRCFGIFHDGEAMEADQDTAVSQVIDKTKFLWIYVSAGDTNLDDLTIYRWLPSD